MHDLRARILKAATRIAHVRGITYITRLSVARRVGCAPGSVSYIFKSMDGLRDAVYVEAIKTEDLKIIAQGLAVRHPRVVEARADLRQRAAQCLA